MNKQELLQLTKSKIILLDGATGTNLQEAGMPAGVCPETWILDNPEVLARLQADFYLAGSDIVYAFSFGANRIKLHGHGLASDRAFVIDLNRRLADLSCKVRDRIQLDLPKRKLMVAGDLSPTGLFLKPVGDLDFDELVEIYREQVDGLLQSSIDLFVVETMIDLAQTRAAVIAVREASNLPIIATVTVEKNGKTISGDAMDCYILAMSSLDVQAAGINCSFGPDLLISKLKNLPKPDSMTLAAKPNAGIPRLNEEGRTVFDMNPGQFAEAMTDIKGSGIRFAGGCCGTTPLHIKALSAQIEKMISIDMGKSTDHDQSILQEMQTKVVPAPGFRLTGKGLEQALVASSRQTASLVDYRNWPMVTCSDFTDLIDAVLDCADDEPDGICIDMTFFSEIDHAQIKEFLSEIQLNTFTPIIFRTSDQRLQQYICRYYNGLTAFIGNNTIFEQSAYFLNA